MTFFHQLQLLFERTYSGIGVDLEACLIGRHRCLELSRMAPDRAAELSMDGRTFLRIVDGRLHVAIWYDPSIIRMLEDHHPFRELSSANIRALIVFIEELNHAVHAGLLFLESRFDQKDGELAANLELQSRIDTYFTLEVICRALHRERALSWKERDWIETSLFDQESFEYTDPRLKARYANSNYLARKCVRHLSRLSKTDRIQAMREFRVKTFREKREWIEACSKF